MSTAAAVPNWLDQNAPLTPAAAPAPAHPLRPPETQRCFSFSGSSQKNKKGSDCRGGRDNAAHAGSRAGAIRRRQSERTSPHHRVRCELHPYGLQVAPPHRRVTRSSPTTAHAQSLIELSHHHHPSSSPSPIQSNSALSLEDSRAVRSRARRW